MFDQSFWFLGDVVIGKLLDGIIDIDGVLWLSVLLIIDVELGDIHILLKMMHLFVTELEVFVFDGDALWWLLHYFINLLLFLYWRDWRYLLFGLDAEALLSDIQDQPVDDPENYDEHCDSNQCKKAVWDGVLVARSHGASWVDKKYDFVDDHRDVDKGIDVIGSLVLRRLEADNEE